MKKMAAFLLSAALLVWCLQEESNDPAIVEMTNTEGLALYLGLEAGLQGDCIELTE